MYKSIKGITRVLIVLLLLTPLTAGATPFTVVDYGGSVGLGTADLKTTAVNIISWLLGIVSLVAVVMIIIGGLLWLTSAGNEERIEKAKKTISSAVIGLILVILAWAIVIFVAGTTKNVTT
ncbi:MAG: pilin [Candidatus Kerfeldbacteria bacterium]